LEPLVSGAPLFTLRSIKEMTMVTIKATILAAAALILASASHAADHWVKVPTTKYSFNNKQDALAFADGKMGWYA
jgi:hypothetical protein